MKTITFKTVIWNKILIGFAFLYFAGVETWLVYSFTNMKNFEPLFIPVISVAGIADAIFLAILIYLFLRKVNAITMEYPYLTIRIIKERKIAYRDIKDIRYRSGRYSGGEYSSGTIYIYLKDEKIVKVSNMKDVRTVCETLRKEILKPNPVIY